jgi:hypothetical protein
MKYFIRFSPFKYIYNKYTSGITTRHKKCFSVSKQLGNPSNNSVSKHFFPLRASDGEQACERQRYFKSRDNRYCQVELEQPTTVEQSDVILSHFEEETSCFLFSFTNHSF